MKRGICHLCGQSTDELTRDHVQPQCAFNEKHRRYLRLDNLYTQSIQPNKNLMCPTVRNVYSEVQPNRPIGGGIYRYTQCLGCNTLLGQNYDARFGAWCEGALDNLKPGELLIFQDEYTQSCEYPLAVLKRVIAMFFSINGENFVAENSDLSEFVRHPHEQRLPQRFGFYVAYNINDIVSHIPLQVRKNVLRGEEIWISQIAHPPFVYAMTLDAKCPDRRFMDIRHFAEFGLDQKADLSVALRVVPTNSFFAGDYRPSGKLVQDDDVVYATEVMPSYFRLVDAVF